MNKQSTVLIVDDQKGWYEAIVPILEKIGCIPYFADGAKSALAELQSRQYDLVILDLRLTEEKEYDVQGLDILENLSKRENAPPVIIWTGHATKALKQKVERFKAFALLEKIGNEKSFDRELFVKTVREAIPKS